MQASTSVTENLLFGYGPSNPTRRYGYFLWLYKLVICNVLPRKKLATKRPVYHSTAIISSATIPFKQAAANLYNQESQVDNPLPQTFQE
jgi:hypothetical protein